LFHDGIGGAGGKARGGDRISGDVRSADEDVWGKVALCRDSGMTDRGGMVTVARMACFTTDEGEPPWGRTVGRDEDVETGPVVWGEKLAVVAVVGARPWVSFSARGENGAEGKRERGLRGGVERGDREVGWEDNKEYGGMRMDVWKWNGV
jgi:hypothetical protein